MRPHGTGSTSGPPGCPGRSACPGPACWPFSGLSPTRVCTRRPRPRRMRGSALRTGCPGRRPGSPYRDRGISRCSAGSSGNAARPGTSCRMRIWPRSPLSTASPSSPRIRISPGSPASHGSIPSQPQPHDDFTEITLSLGSLVCARSRRWQRRRGHRYPPANRHVLLGRDDPAQREGTGLPDPALGGSQPRSSIRGRRDCPACEPRTYSATTGRGWNPRPSGRWRMSSAPLTVQRRPPGRTGCWRDRGPGRSGPGAGLGVDLLMLGGGTGPGEAGAQCPAS